MADFYCYEGLEKAFTFKVDSTTTTAVSADPKQIVGKVVAMTGNYTVGYGSAGDPIIGVVESVEIESTNNKALVVDVRRFRTFEGITCAGTESAGDPLVVDGTGGVKLSTTGGASATNVPTNATALGVDATGKTCTVLIL